MPGIRTNAMRSCFDADRSRLRSLIVSTGLPERCERGDDGRRLAGRAESKRIRQQSGAW